MIPQVQENQSFQPNCYIGTILGVWWLWWRVPLGSHVSRWALSHSPPDITSSNHLSCTSRASFSVQDYSSSQAVEFQQIGAIDRNWPALLQGIHNTIALSQPRYPEGETMPDSRDAFLSLWNPLCHLILLFCLRFCALLLLLHSYVHLLCCFQVKDEQDGIGQDDNRSSLPMPLSSSLSAPLMCCWNLLSGQFVKNKHLKITSWKNYLTLSALSLSVQGAPPILCGGTCSIGGAIVQCLRRSRFVTALKRRRRQCCHMCCSALCGSLPLLFLQHHPSFFLVLFVLFFSYLVCMCLFQRLPCGKL